MALERAKLLDKAKLLLERACHAGNTTRVSALLAAGAVVSDKVGCPLFIAIHRDNVKLASLLVARGAKVNQARETPVQGAPTQRITPLWAAILSGSAKLVSVLLLAADAAVNQAIEDGWTPLVYAMHRSNAELVSLLLAAGAVVDQTMDNGWTPLVYAIHSANAELVPVLLEAGAAVNQAKEDGTTPLLLAIQQGNAELVPVLLAAGTEVNQAREDGTTPLLLAIQQGNAELVSVLLEAGAAVNQAPHEPLAQTLVPLLSAITMGRTDCAKLLSSYGASRSFDIQGINIPMAASEMATHYGHDALAAWFVTSSQWTTPLHHLTIIGATRARALLRDGADLEAAAEAGGGPTPLSLARALLQADKAGEDTAASLVLDAAKPWSQQTHALFPAAARARAVELMLLGHRLSRESVQWGPSFVGAEVSLFDAWMVGVLPQAVQRGFCQL